MWHFSRTTPNFYAWHLAAGLAFQIVVTQLPGPRSHKRIRDDALFAVRCRAEELIGKLLLEQLAAARRTLGHFGMWHSPEAKVLVENYGAAMEEGRHEFERRLQEHVRAHNSRLRRKQRPKTKSRSPNQRTAGILTQLERRVWDALADTILQAKELAKELGSDEDTVRHAILGLRRKGRKVENQRGRGYYRPDALPDDANTPTAVDSK